MQLPEQYVLEHRSRILTNNNHAFLPNLQTCWAVIAVSKSNIFVYHAQAGESAERQTGLNSQLNDFNNKNKITAVLLVGGDNSYPSNITKYSLLKLLEKYTKNITVQTTNEEDPQQGTFSKIVNFAIIYAKPLGILALFFAAAALFFINTKPRLGVAFAYAAVFCGVTFLLGCCPSSHTGTTTFLGIKNVSGSAKLKMTKSDTDKEALRLFSKMMENKFSCRRAYESLKTELN